MNIPLLDALDRLTRSLPYKVWAATSPIEARKVKAELDGERRPSARSLFAASIIDCARIAWASDPPPPPPPPPPDRYAPQTYNRGSSGQDARYCTTGLPRTTWGELYEPSNPGIRYDDNGLCKGGRSGNPVEGLKPADQMDGRGPCDPYTHEGRTFPPWPEASYQL